MATLLVAGVEGCPHFANTAKMASQLSSKVGPEALGWQQFFCIWSQFFSLPKGRTQARNKDLWVVSWVPQLVKWIHSGKCCYMYNICHLDDHHFSPEILWTTCQRAPLFSFCSNGMLLVLLEQNITSPSTLRTTPTLVERMHLVTGSLATFPKRRSVRMIIKVIPKFRHTPPIFFYWLSRLAVTLRCINAE